MIDVVSIIIAIVSLVGSLAAAGFTGWISFYIDQVKRRSAAKSLIHKYRDPLMLAAYDLQSRIWGLVQQGLLSYHADEDKKELVFVYTAFLVGQYLSWTYVLRRQAQFLRFSTDKTNKQLNQVLDAITNEFSLDRRRGEDPFMLWRGQQMAIGELMTLEEENGQLYCMGFAAFAHRYHSDLEFKKWFQPIDAGIALLVQARERNNNVATFRLRRLQHLLIDLVLLLDQDGVALSPATAMKVDAARKCECFKCPSRMAPSSQTSKPPEP
ncbi:hypothetical protein D0Z07_0873 [Hyphodiscus hymeniophilus]|uniref:Uncharacterized protein n=1 Tax=Hyphodiscus hymeniophilus TaxID=353542 RepID=A0A9P6VQX5_9HELO|nr:hypothetical protein D0Z07_0873 [Hyphodiscus hymeniophilus]